MPLNASPTDVPAATTKNMQSPAVKTNFAAGRKISLRDIDSHTFSEAVLKANKVYWTRKRIINDEQTTNRTYLVDGDRSVPLRSVRHVLGARSGPADDRPLAARPQWTRRLCPNRRRPKRSALALHHRPVSDVNRIPALAQLHGQSRISDCSASDRSQCSGLCIGQSAAAAAAARPIARLSSHSSEFSVDRCTFKCILFLIFSPSCHPESRRRLLTHVTPGDQRRYRRQSTAMAFRPTSPWCHLAAITDTATVLSASTSP